MAHWVKNGTVTQEIGLCYLYGTNIILVTYCFYTKFIFMFPDSFQFYVAVRSGMQNENRVNKGLTKKKYKVRFRQQMYMAELKKTCFFHLNRPSHSIERV